MITLELAEEILQARKASKVKNPKIANYAKRYTKEELLDILPEASIEVVSRYKVVRIKAGDKNREVTNVTKLPADDEQALGEMLVMALNHLRVKHYFNK